jgi:RNA recognition motif-containing protein
MMKKRIYVDNLAWDTTENELRDLFTPIGTVSSLLLMPDANNRLTASAILEMTDDAARMAIAEINGHTFKARVLTVKDPTDIASWLWTNKSAA